MAGVGRDPHRQAGGTRGRAGCHDDRRCQRADPGGGARQFGLVGAGEPVELGRAETFDGGPGIAFDHLPSIDAVLVTHNHYNHMDTGTLRRLQAAHPPRIVTALGNDMIIRGAMPGAARRLPRIARRYGPVRRSHWRCRRT